MWKVVGNIRLLFPAYLRRHPDIPIPYVLLFYIPLLVIPTPDIPKIKIEVLNMFGVFCSLFLFPIFIQVFSNIDHFESKNCSIFIPIFVSMNIEHLRQKILPYLYKFLLVWISNIFRPKIVLYLYQFLLVWISNIFRPKIVLYFDKFC